MGVGGLPLDSSSVDISKELLESILGEPVQDYKTQAGSNEGDNVASVLTSVVVTTCTKQTRHLLYKTFPVVNDTFNDEKGRQRILKFFTTEHLFYRTIAPMYESIVNTHLGSNAKASYEFPFPTYCPNGPGVSTVWLEDLRPEGYKMLNKLEGLTLQETDLVLTELGKFHAITYMLIRQFGEKLFNKELAHIKVNLWLVPESREEWKGMFTGHWRNTMRLLRSRGHGAWVERMSKVDDEDTFELALGAVLGTDRKYFPVLVHGDLWTNNILFKFDEHNRPVGVKFVDFQLTRRGNIYEELVYFIYTTTTPEFRAKHLTNVLHSYYNSFTTFLQSLSCPKPINFSLGSFLDEFDANRKYAYVYMMFAIPLQLSTFSLGELGDQGTVTDAMPVTVKEGDPTQTEFVRKLYYMLKNSPPALQRLEAITSEMIQLKVF